MSNKIQLTATCTPTEKNKKKGAHIVIWLNGGKTILATARKGGNWNAEQALQELKKNPKGFQLAPTFANLTEDQVKAMVA